jgi:hypothetical protein
MKVYELKFDHSVEYQRFYPCDDDWNFEGLFENHGPLPSNWQMPDVYISEPKLAKPNIYGLGCSLEYFIVDQVALEYTRTLLERSGQLIDFEYENEKFSFFKPIHCLNCLDREKTVWRSPERTTGILRRVFFKNRLDEIPIFTIIESPWCFAIEGMMSDEEEELKYCIDHYKLKGLALKEEWSDET